VGDISDLFKGDLPENIGWHRNWQGNISSYCRSARWRWNLQHKF